MTEQVYNGVPISTGSSVSNSILSPKASSELSLSNSLGSSCGISSSNTNQVSSNQNLNESKSKRIKILRILAVKTACLLKWNLLKFEKE
jgi:hypothetical protein